MGYCFAFTFCFQGNSRQANYLDPSSLSYFRISATLNNGLNSVFQDAAFKIAIAGQWKM